MIYLLILIIDFDSHIFSNFLNDVSSIENDLFIFILLFLFYILNNNSQKLIKINKINKINKF